MSFHGFPPPHDVDSPVGIHGSALRVEDLLQGCNDLLLFVTLSKSHQDCPSFGRERVGSWRNGQLLTPRQRTRASQLTHDWMQRWVPASAGPTRSGLLRSGEGGREAGTLGRGRERKRTVESNRLGSSLHTGEAAAAAMFAGICGKRLGLEEIFGSPASPPPSAKRPRCAQYGSPVHPSSGSEDKLSLLLGMFPSMDREVVETILNTHNHNIDDAINSLRALCLGDGSVSVDGVNTYFRTSDITLEGGMCSQTSEQRTKVSQNMSGDFKSQDSEKGPSWVDIFVQEMSNASDWSDIQARAMKILEAFERNVVMQTTRATEHEVSSLKDQLQSLLRDNQILKRAVAIQHERNAENEQRIREVQHLKHAISQYQEQIRALEMSNYTLKIHLQRAQEGSSIAGRFHPDIL
ncbi:hypothetical protein Cni_G25285 [Canna indica]|uniref:CUE domain-containing protein n=1 Tax=Canna indica TaxID=4628 RepID=A0AAQ3QP36_9LILI|nr:hypothetical protein Cni_G25285 [Canna indica]